MQKVTPQKAPTEKKVYDQRIPSPEPQNIPKDASSSEILKIIDSMSKKFDPPSQTFSMPKFCEIFNIDMSKLSPLEGNATKKKAQRLWQKGYENMVMEQHVNKMESVLMGGNVPKGTIFHMKVFDDAMRCAKLIKVGSDDNCSSITEIIKKIIQKDNVSLMITVAKGETKILDDKSLSDAMNFVYFSDKRCLTVSAI